MIQSPTIKSSSPNNPGQSNHGMRNLLIVAAVVILCGIGLGYYYSQLPENNPQKNQSNCEQAGGEWAAEQGTCLLSNRVTGDECTDGGQCQSGICSPSDLTSEQESRVASGEVVTGISGTCHADVFAEGCIPQVYKGKVSLDSLCLE